MNEKGREVEINGKKYNLVYTSAAMLAILDKFGGVDRMADKCRESQEETARITPWLIALLANQGIMLETGNTNPNNPDLFTPELVALWTMPKEWYHLINECMGAIAIGNGTYHKAVDDGPVDVVLEEIEKNAAGAGE